MIVKGVLHSNVIPNCCITAATKGRTAEVDLAPVFMMLNSIDLDEYAKIARV
jgi:hypothetical protein